MRYGYIAPISILFALSAMFTPTSLTYAFIDNPLQTTLTAEPTLGTNPYCSCMLFAHAIDPKLPQGAVVTPAQRKAQPGDFALYYHMAPDLNHIAWIPFGDDGKGGYWEIGANIPRCRLYVRHMTYAASDLAGFIHS